MRAEWRRMASMTSRLVLPASVTMVPGLGCGRDGGGDAHPSGRPASPAAQSWRRRGHPVAQPVAASSMMPSSRAAAGLGAPADADHPLDQPRRAQGQREGNLRSADAADDGACRPSSRGTASARQSGRTSRKRAFSASGRWRRAATRACRSRRWAHDHAARSSSAG